MARSKISNWIVDLTKMLGGSDKKTVLAIDDDVTLLQLLRFRFERLRGYDFYTAETGADGLEIAENRKPDLIVLDWVMPEMSGLNTLRKLRRNPLTKDIPVLMLTGKNLMGDAEKALAAGATGYVTKPITPSKLFVRIYEMVHGKKFVNQVA